MHMKMRAAFLRILRLPTLKEVSILDIPLSAFDERQNLTRLLLRSDFSYSEPQVQSRYPRLSFLSLGNLDLTMVPWVRTLSSLVLHVDDPDGFQQLLESCSDTLIRLNMNPYVNCTLSLLIF